jgi:hypothetical protein
MGGPRWAGSDAGKRAMSCRGGLAVDVEQKPLKMGKPYGYAMGIPRHNC